MSASTNPICLLNASRLGRRWPLHGAAATRVLESRLAPHAPLMLRAGLSVARLAMALAPHAQSFWIACGPGNNGGDGLQAAIHLRAWGKTVQLTWLGREDACPADTLAALRRAREAGLVPQVDVPVPNTFEFAIDALLGLGARARPFATGIEHFFRDCIGSLNAARAQGITVLAIDLPSGLNADTGRAEPVCVQASHTLTLLTVKPGLFTLQGRDHAGDVWFDDLQRPGDDDASLWVVSDTATAWLTAAPTPQQRAHHSHKGSYGTVNIIGGTDGMAGAALLAARAAARTEPWHSGAGKVFVGMLAEPPLTVDTLCPQLLFRSAEALDLSHGCTVLGCGAGASTRALNQLSRALTQSPCLVLDADALNLITQHIELQSSLSVRSDQGQFTVLTPHPLEAARLLDGDTSIVQADRLASAQVLADRFRSVVVLKGSGTVVAAPLLVPCLNPSGNALLATAGSGDVLAGLLGAALAQWLAKNSHSGTAGSEDIQQVVANAVYLHGAQVD